MLHFASPAALASFRADPRRTEHAPLLERSGARMELLEMEDAAG